MRGAVAMHVPFGKGRAKLSTTAVLETTSEARPWDALARPS